MNEAAQLPAFLPALPEIVLVLGAMALLMLGVFRGEGSARAVNWIAIMLLAIVAMLVVWPPVERVVTFGGSFVVDDFARFMKILALIGSGAAIAMSLDFFAAEKQQRFEYPVLIMLSTAGMMLLISASDLISLYLGLELMSLCLYVLAAIQRDSVRSTEAGLKYFVLGALSSGMLLYGASLVYGATGSVSFAEIARAGGQGGLALVFGLVFLFAGFCFKVSAVPFHMWTPDVYEGAPTPVTAFFAAAPKVAAIAMIVRTTIAAFPGITDQWQQILVFVSIASMALGAFAAIGQRNIKRLMAYSSIGHMGFALIGLAAATEEGVRGVLVYMAIYLTMTLGTFACILAMRRGDVLVEDIGDLAGLARTKPAMAFLFAMLLYGASLLYGFTGSTSFAGIAAAAAQPGAGENIGLIIGLVFLLVGIAFKVSAVPFHMWTPDVYEGAPTPVTAFFASAPKVAAMALFMRVALESFAGIKPQWQQVVTALAIASMVLGAFAAIGQTNIKRLLAYSAIGNIGYTLIGLAAGSPEGARGVIIYLVIYVAMTLGAFACVLAMRRPEGMVEDIDELSGLAQNNLAMATVFAILLFSLAGIPPLAGFFAKFYVFVAAVKEGLWALAVIGVLASVVGAYYYVRIVKIMFFDEPREKFASIQPKAGLVMGVMGLYILLYVVWPAPLVEAAGTAAKSLF